MEPLTLALLSGLVVVGLAYVFTFVAKGRALKNSKLSQSTPPGPKGVPLLGYIPYLRPPLFLHFNQLAQQYGPVYQVKMGQMNFVILNTYEVFKQAFLDDADNFSGRLQSDYINEVSQSSGILFLDGGRWKEHRRFSLRVLRDLGFGKQSTDEYIRQEISELVTRLQDLNGQPVQTLDLLNRSVANIICSLIFGERPGYEEKGFTQILEDLNFLAHDTSFINMAPIVFPSLKPITPLFLLFSSVNRPREITLKCQEYIGAKVDERMPHVTLATVPTNFTEAYLLEKLRLDQENNPHTYTRMQLVRTIFELFIAGLDTTASTLSWGFLLMSIYPEIQRRVRHEIHSVLGDETEINLSHRKSLPYCCATVDEIYRFSSIAPLGVPHRTFHDTSIAGHHIPQNTIVMPNIYAVHHDPKAWSTPNDFNPHHFLDKSGTVYQPRQDLIPFNIGRRSCLGESLARAETFQFFTSILQKFHISLNEPQNHDMKTLLLGTEGTIRVPAKHCLSFHKC